MNTDQIIILLSGAGLGAVLSAFLVFINNSKKNKLDFITKERSEWRKDIQIIVRLVFFYDIINLSLIINQILR